MKELIPSKDVRDYLKEREHIFSDSEKATLIYNSDWSRPEKHEALSELGSVTADLELKKQIAERNQWNERCLEKIKDNSEQHVYKLEIWGEEDHEYMDTGIFATWELAEDDACDSEVATVRYNEKGEVADYSDVSFPIEIVDENANFGHMHVNPMDVEYAEFEEGDERASLMWMASQLVQGNAYIQEFQAYCESDIEKKRRPQR